MGGKCHSHKAKGASGVHGGPAVSRRAHVAHAAPGAPTISQSRCWLSEITTMVGLTR